MNRELGMATGSYGCRFSYLILSKSEALCREVADLETGFQRTPLANPLRTESLGEKKKKKN